MKLTKEQVAVFIEDEPHLQQARELMERYRQPIAEDGTFSLSDNSRLNNLRCFTSPEEWFLGLKGYCSEITLSELEEILKQELEKM